MIEAWLDLPVWQMFVTLALGFGTSALVILAIAFMPLTRAKVLALGGVVPPYFSGLAVLLALLTGFVANDTWERQKKAVRVLQSESDNVLALYDLSIAAAPDMSSLRGALKNYVTAVIDDEWPQMANAKSSRRAAEALGALLEQVAQPKVATEAGAAPQAAMLSAALKIRADRGERISINAHQSDTSKWLAILILGLLTQIAIGLVHLEKRPAFVVTQLVFMTALVSTLGLIAEHEWPFDGPSALQPHELRLVKKRFEADLAAGVPAIGKPPDPACRMK